MTAKLLIREVGAREFIAFNGNYDNDLMTNEFASVGTGPVPQTGEDKATTEGERLCAEGNVEAFQVWSLVVTKQRVWALEEIEG